ncbi:MAG: hypothetical protein ACRER4_08485, partial [Steroidobacteraceae bacterium]
MSITNCLRWLLPAAASLLLVAACSATHDPNPPVGELGKTVIPSHYSIDLSIDPSKDRFSGTVVIDILLNESQDAIWLHGKNLDVAEVYLTDSDSDRIDASYAERLDSGVALVTLASGASAGPAKLHFSYSAPFNTSVNALFKMDRDGDYYAATQFEPIAARQVFP